MDTYGIGGTEVKGDASEAISEIQQNRTLMIEKLTADAPVKPQIVQGITKIEEVFEHFKPKIDVEFQDSEGVSRQETLKFGNLADFGIKGITAQSEFLQNLTMQKEQLQKVIKQLKSNKMMRKALENGETKLALLNSIYAMIKEIEQA
ncbi:MAG: type VI secretion system contractile sheath small subunit [Bacteroidetes bacterium]|nr:type VI secretion system contractile sheath small subunit [Bacteroidota bacterium]